MKTFILGLIVSIALNTISSYTWLHTGYGTVHNISRFVKFEVLEGKYILDPLSGNCQNKIGHNGFGWKFNVADYHRCDRFQRLLNGNLTARNYNSPTI